MKLFITDPSQLDAPSRQLLSKLGVPEGMPFFLDDGGNYVSSINAFFRSLPSDGVRSKHSWLAYARDIKAWATFLGHERAIHNVWHASRADVRAYHVAKRVLDPDTAVSARTWNRWVAALDRLYRWGKEQGLIDSVPFSYRYSVAFLEESRIVAENRSKEKAAVRRTMRFFTPQEYVRFRNLGVLGLNTDGTTDESYRGRTYERNAALCELLVTSGLRIAEANALSQIELPMDRQEASSAMLPFELASAITKNRKPRQVLLAKRVLRDIGNYCQFERQEAILRGRAAGAYEEDRWIIFTQATPRSGVRSDGKRVLWAKLPPDRRRQVLIEDAQGYRSPLCLWLSDDGEPLTTSAWNKIFSRAATRCRSLGFPTEAYPHKLRHTFASNLKDMLDSADYRGNSLRVIQLLLGHASIETTGIYADATPETLRQSSEAADDWAQLLQTMEERTSHASR